MDALDAAHIPRSVLRSAETRVARRIIHRCEKARHAPRARLLKSLRTGEQRVQVPLPLSARRQRAHAFIIACFVEQRSEQRGHAVQTLDLAEPIQRRSRLPCPLRERIVGVFRILRRGKREKRLVEGRLPPRAKPELQKRLLGKAEQGRAQHGQQRNILPAIVDDAQHVQKHHDLDGVEIPAARLRIARDAAQRQRLRKGLRLRRCAQKDRDVAVSERTLSAALCIIDRHVRHERADALRNEPRLDRRVLHVLERVRILVLLDRLGNEMQARAAVRHLRARDELHALVVGHFAHLLAHDRGEHGVHGMENLLCAAEVFGQVDAPALPAVLPAGELFQKQRGLRGAEPIDGLLDVAHKKQVVRSPDAREQRLLYAVAVLILVHGDDAVFAPVFLGDPIFPEQRDRQMLHVRKVHDVPLLLQRAVCRDAGADERFEREDNGKCLEKQRRFLLGAPGHGGKLLFDERLDAVARVLDGLFVRVRRAFGKAHRRECHQQKPGAVAVIAVL